MLFPVVMYGCESWTVKKAECWRIDAFELWCWRRLLRVPWAARRSNQSILKRSALDFFGRTDAKAETPVLWSPHAKSWLIGNDSDAGRDWGQEEKGMTEDEMAGWHHRLDGHEFEWTPGVGDGQRGLACCDSWGWKESDTTERLNWTELGGNYVIPIWYFLGFPCDSAGKESAWNVGDLRWSLGWEDPLEKRKATHSSILAWRIPRTV